MKIFKEENKINPCSKMKCVVFYGIETVEN